MTNKAFLILIALVVIMAGVAGIFSTMQEQGSADGGLLLPTLAGSLNEIETITVRRGGGVTIATLKKGKDRWTIAEAGDYPANLALIRQNLIALSTARVVEKKTAKPEFYDRLGVRDIDLPDAAGTLLEIEGAGEPLAVIIGHTAVGGGSMAYTRRVGEKQSLMVSAEGLEPGTDLSDWLERQVLDIPSTRIFAVTVSHPDGESFRIEKASRDSTEFRLLNIPEGRQLSYPGVANTLGAVLSDLQLDNVEPAADFQGSGDSAIVSRFESFDGMVVEARAWQTADGTRLRFSVSADADLAARFQEDDETADFDSILAEAGKLNERLSGWVYTLPGYKSDQLIKRRDDLLAPADE